MSGALFRGDLIYRYEVPVDDQWHGVPLTGDPLAVASRDPRGVEFWAGRDPGVEPRVRMFRVVGTGHAVPEAARHWGTAVTADGALVWHLLELAGGEARQP